MIVTRERRACEQIEQRFADVRGRRSALQHLVLGKVRLELDGIRPGGRGRVDELGSDCDVAVVVDARLGDHETRPASADLPCADGDVRRFRH